MKTAKWTLGRWSATKQTWEYISPAGEITTKPLEARLAAHVNEFTQDDRKKWKDFTPTQIIIETPDGPRKEPEVLPELWALCAYSPVDARFLYAGTAAGVMTGQPAHAKLWSTQAGAMEGKQQAGMPQLEVIRVEFHLPKKP